eukprot:9974743-Ditylum_brightwellii.AAC.1
MTVPATYVETLLEQKVAVTVSGYMANIVYSAIIQCSNSNGAALYFGRTGSPTKSKKGKN